MSRGARRTLFFVGAAFICTFPANLQEHFSEKYICPLLLPLACVVGLAVDGWRTATEGRRVQLTCTSINEDEIGRPLFGQRGNLIPHLQYAPMSASHM